jgi:2-polyprenyl-6-methoxyphenol hydroxylase-like FAD-dependent oxidoreductase
MDAKNVAHHEIQLPHASRGTYRRRTMQEVPVLIVGGSLVGLTTALLLRRHGIECVAVERHAGTAIHPRAGHFQLRTMEILREAGLEDRAREASLAMYHPRGGINSVESLAGRERAVYIADLNEGIEGLTPTTRLFLNQDVLEPILRERALELGAQVLNRTEVVSLEEDADGVTALLRDLDGGEERSVRARYVVAADGNRSPVRRRLGIEMEGFGLLSRSITIYFRADVAPLLRDRNQGVIYVHNQQLRGFFRIDRTGGQGFLVVNTVGEDVTRPEAVDVSSHLTPERPHELLRVAIGADIPTEVLDVAHWQAEANNATSYGSGRIFLAGDAAHVVPPNGGFGGNTGIQDAHNLAWKLAWVLTGRAGPALLQTYDAERRPVGRATVDQAYARYATRVVPERTEGEVPELVPDIAIEIGQVVRSTAVLDGAGDDGPVLRDPSEIGGRPGTRAPHVALPDGSSTLDLLGGGLVLLAGPDGAGWSAPDVTTHVIDADGFGAAYGIGPSGAVLVRPDGIVAWRAADGPRNDELPGVLDRVLSRSDEGATSAPPARASSR